LLPDKKTREGRKAPVSIPERDSGALLHRPLGGIDICGFQGTFARLSQQNQIYHKKSPLANRSKSPKTFPLNSSKTCAAQYSIQQASNRYQSYHPANIFPVTFSTPTHPRKNKISVHLNTLDTHYQTQTIDQHNYYTFSVL
jgi:hypothetical protein